MISHRASFTLYFFKIASPLFLALSSSKSLLGSDCLVPNETKHPIGLWLKFHRWIWHRYDFECSYIFISFCMMCGNDFRLSIRPLISSFAPLSNPSHLDSNIAYFLFLIAASIFSLVVLISFKGLLILPTFPGVQKVKPIHKMTRGKEKSSNSLVWGNIRT